MHEWKWQLCSNLNEIESVDRTCIKLSTRLVRQSLRQKFPQTYSLKSWNQIIFWSCEGFLVSAGPSWTDWKSFSTISRVSVSLFTAQAISPSFLGVLTKASSALLLARILDLLWYLTVFFQPALMLLRVITLYYFGSNFSRHFICELGFLGWFLPCLQDESRILFDCCENQSKKILFVIPEPFLEYGTIQESSEKTILVNCNLPFHKQNDIKQ